MIRIDITPAQIVRTEQKKMQRGKEITEVRQRREITATARRGDEVIAIVAVPEGLSISFPILRLVKKAGAEPDEEVLFFRGTTQVFVSMTLDQWLNPPKKPRKGKKNAGDKTSGPVSGQDAG